MTLLILTFGEITPKVIAIRNSEKISLFVAPYINIFSKLTLPARKVLQVITGLITPMFSKKIKTQKQDLTEEELKTAVELARKGGALNIKEEEMIKSVIRFGDKTAKDVLITPKRIAACDITTPLKTIRSIITNKELSRMPIFENKLENIIGILYAKDLFVAGLKGPFALRDILREPFYISSAIKLDDLLREFRRHRVHMALVKDLKGKFIGLVTLQDLLEEIMGQIRDIKA
jgi:CBS domain containing-hemolysin-like protein